MSFDWKNFFTSHSIEYIESGANVSSGNVNIHCPFCGAGDPSYHMGVSLTGKGWACWRDSKHRGKNPVTLVSALLGISKERAYEIVGSRRVIPSDFHDQVTSLLSAKHQADLSKGLDLPEEFKPIKKLPSAKLVFQYLKSRGFTESQILSFTELYGLRYCVRGPYKGRIIFPLYYKKKLMSWTGRTVYRDEMIRYKTLTTKPEKAEKEGLGPAVAAIGNFLLWYDTLKKTEAKTIVLVEGPFDALNVCVLGRAHGIVSTCFFTTVPSQAQIAILHEVLPKFHTKILLLDQGTLPKAIYIKAQLSSLGVEMVQLPKSVDDPGELNKEQLLHLVQE